MNAHSTFTQVVDVNQAVVHVGLIQDIGGVDTLYGSSASGQSASFHPQLFGLQGRVPRRALTWLALLLLFLSTAGLALPSLNQDGERVEVASHLVEDKTNVIFFHAPWSKTSSRYQVELQKWSAKNDDVAVFQVDVGSLKSAVAKQYKLTSVPAFLIYDGEGTLKMQGQEAHNEVVKMLAE